MDVRFLVRLTLALAATLLPALPGPALADDPSGKLLPEACRTDCISAYGTVLGAARGGVPAYSNCNADCVIFEPYAVDGTYTGIKWQCVEFARRWLLQHRRAVYGDVDVAADIWTKVDHLERVADQSPIPLEAYPNGSSRPPAPGDLLIYARAYLDTGHVAVITGVDLTSQTLRVAEQNYLNAKWPGDYARQIDLVVKGGRYWVLDPYVLGWKRVAEAPAPTPSPARP